MKIGLKGHRQDHRLRQVFTQDNASQTTPSIYSSQCPCLLLYTIKKHHYSRRRKMSSKQIKKRFTFDRRKLPIDPVPTIYYYRDRDTNINEAVINSVKLNYDPSFYYNKDVNVNLIPISVCDWIWDDCNFVLKINKKIMFVEMPPYLYDVSMCTSRRPVGVSICSHVCVTWLIVTEMIVWCLRKGLMKYGLMNVNIVLESSDRRRALCSANQHRFRLSKHHQEATVS